MRKGLTAFRAPQAPETHLDASFNDPPLTHLYALFGRSVRDRPDTATALLGPPLRPGLAIFSAVPETKKEFVDVFGEEAVPSRSALEAVRAGSLALDRIKGSHVAVITLAQVVEAIGRMRESTVLLVGHNESGVLISPSGNRLPLGDIARSCARFGKLCIFLSCRAAKHVPGAHGPMVDVSPLQASRMASKIAAMLDEQPTKSLEALVPAPVVAPMIYADPWRLVRNVDAIIAEETTGRTRLFYVGLSVGGVIIVALVVVDLDGTCDEKSEDCSI
ncbi:hypothetical protein [Sphingomonas lacusdianchii]|uniref:hypothetical protein n=1 Tax=Sphingomonas lacusdianchii TaxID=2917992 RepID=UPI001F5A35DE|nr:hypothetical protein [Sphingomonas sp. JXJ CY 53]